MLDQGLDLCSVAVIGVVCLWVAGGVSSVAKSTVGSWFDSWNDGLRCGSRWIEFDTLVEQICFGVDRCWVLGNCRLNSFNSEPMS